MIAIGLQYCIIYSFEELAKVRDQN